MSLFKYKGLENMQNYKRLILKDFYLNSQMMNEPDDVHKYFTFAEIALIINDMANFFQYKKQRENLLEEFCNLCNDGMIKHISDVPKHFNTQEILLLDDSIFQSLGK